MRLIYQSLNIFFFIFHSCLIIFNLFGWLWRKTRLANFIVIGLTLSSWFLLGLRFGYGYCPFTDWHWQVREKLGFRESPPSYTAFLVRELTGWEPGDTLVNSLTLGLLIAALAGSVVTNVRDLIKRKPMPRKK
ncbi:MAG: DUF2784 family protein [Candidatus Aminicenantales bacterium]